MPQKNVSGTINKSIPSAYRINNNGCYIYSDLDSMKNSTINLGKFYVGYRLTLV